MGAGANPLIVGGEPARPHVATTVVTRCRPRHTAVQEPCTGRKEVLARATEWIRRSPDSATWPWKSFVDAWCKRGGVQGRLHAVTARKTAVIHLSTRRVSPVVVPRGRRRAARLRRAFESRRCRPARSASRLPRVEPLPLPPAPGRPVGPRTRHQIPAGWSGWRQHLPPCSFRR